MSETAANTEDTPIADTDLDLIDDGLEDEGKSEEDIFDEIEQEESKAGEAPDEDDGANTVAPTDDPGAAADDDGENDDVLPDDTQAADKTAATQAADKEDPWADAKPEQKAAFDAAQAQIRKLEQSDRSQRGRIAAAQRQINGLMKHSKPASDPAAETSAADTTASKPAGDPAAVLKTDAWKSFAAEYPEVAKPQEAAFAALIETVESQGRQLEVIGTAREIDAVNEQVTLLLEMHEDYEEVMAAPELLPWLEDQPAHIQEAAIQNGKEIVDAAVAADVVSRFKAFRSAEDDSTETDESNTDTALVDDDKVNGKPLTDKRKRQLETASTSRAGGPGAAHGVPEDGDEESIWNAIEKQEKRERQAQRA